jgi:hypothetical protein
MRGLTTAVWTTFAALAILAPGLGATSARASSPPIVMDVVFTVTNKVPDTPPAQQLCPSGSVDGKTYNIPGRLVGPPSALAGRSITLYLHGTTTSANFDFTAVPGYDYQSQVAALGHASLVINQLGFRPNGSGDLNGPNGLKVCLGAQADIAHQVMSQLRAGTYAITKVEAGPVPAAPPAFRRVALAALSGGTQIQELEEWEWHDADGLVVMSRPEDPGSRYTFLAPVFLSHIGAYLAVCSPPASTGNPPQSFYASFWNTNEDEVNDVFYRPDLNDPRVIQAFKGSIEPLPCFAPSDATLQSSYTYPITQRPVPVLVIFGDQDVLCPSAVVPADNLFNAETGTCQSRARERYLLDRPTGTLDTTFFQVCLTKSCGNTADGAPIHAGHELVLELPPAAAQFRDTMDQWLTTHGF